MEEEQILEWLDENNRRLLIEIENSAVVRFSPSDMDSYGCQVHRIDQNEEREVEIFYLEPLSQAKIAHELLHAKVDLVLGNGISLFDVPNITETYQNFLRSADQIVNACEHYIFFPDYLEMGYNVEESFEEYVLAEDVRDQYDALCLRGLRAGLRYNVNRVFQFMALAFTFCLYPDNERFADEKERLKRIDRVLYNKVDRLREACDIDIIPENREWLEDGYRQFSRSMNSWFRANGFR